MFKPVSRVLILVGVLQGAVLWWLWHAHEHHLWPATEPMCLGGILWAALAVPFTWYLSECTGLPTRRRAVLVGGVGLAYALFGVYAGWMGTPLNALEKSAPPAAFGEVLAALAAVFVLLPLVSAWEPVARRWNYPRLFELAWRNALLCVSVAVLTGLFWAVLYAGATLMSSLGLKFIRELIEEPIFVFPVTGMVVGAIFANGLARASMLDNLRRFWLALNAWLLPLLLGFSVMWVVALPFTGLAELFATRNAAFYLLWFAVLAVKFLNAAWQDGREAAAFPPLLANLARLAWPSLLLVTGVAAWALAQRVVQYGWTEDRVWACFVSLLAMAYAAGYSLSLLPRFRARGWMATVGATNIGVALLALICLVLLVSPLADPRRLAVNSQVARLHAGEFSAEAFDYRYLRFEAGRWGQLALRDLSLETGDARTADIAGRAKQMLARTERYGDDGEPLAQEPARQRIRVLPAGGALEEALLERLRRPGNWREGYCLSADRRCTAWLHDFNGDGRHEVLLVSHAEDQTGHALLYAKQASGWALVSVYDNGMPMKELLDAIEQEKFKTVPPEWPDLMLGNKRVRVNGPD